MNRRRVAFATTSTSDSTSAISVAFMGLRSLLALDTKLPGGHCLTHIGREGNVYHLIYHPSYQNNLFNTAITAPATVLASSKMVAICSVSKKNAA